MTGIALRTIARVAPLVADGRVSPVALVEECLANIRARQPELNAFIAVMEAEALDAARAAERELASGYRRGPLHGIPISLKDLIDVRGMPTTAASAVRVGHIARSDARVVTRLREAGAILIGKCNLHEFAFGTTNEESAYGAARHPLDPARSPGGSSGGSAASVVAGMAFASVGTDTGGSIRIPAAACGLVGLKGSYGEVPADGVVPLSETCDHVGPLARCTTDAWMLFETLAGRPADVEALSGSDRPLRFGVPRRYFLDLLDADVRAAFARACAEFARAGWICADVEIAHADLILPVYLHVVLAESAVYHAATLDRRADDYTQPVRDRLEMARYVLAEDYLRALKGRRVLATEVDRALTGVDALLLPALPMVAHPLGTTTVRFGERTESIRNAMLRLTQLFNLTGHPAVSLSMGTGEASGLPCGLQLVGVRNATGALMRAARQVETVLAPFVAPA